MTLTRRLLRWTGLFVLGCGSSAAGPGEQPVGRADGPLTFTVDASRTYEISRFIYGANFLETPSIYGGATPRPASR